MKNLKNVIGLLTVTTTLAIQVQAQSFLTNGLVAYYPLNGSVNDASGNGNNGNPHNITYTTGRFGAQSNAALFSGQLGTNSAIDCPTLDNFQYFPVTYSCWFRLDGYTVADGEVMTLVGREQSDFPGTEGAVVLVSSQELGYTNELTYTTPQLFHFNRFALSTNVWYNSILTIDSNALMSLYINGSLYGSVQSSPSALAGSVPLPFRIGASTLATGSINPGAPRYCWSGAIDDVRIYDVALSSNQVQQLYQYESAPQVGIVEAVVPTFSNLYIGTNYQLQISTNLSGTFTNFGSAFTATNSTMIYPEYFNVANWNELFFRLQTAP